MQMKFKNILNNICLKLSVIAIFDDELLTFDAKLTK